MRIEAFFAVVAIVLTIVGGRVRSGEQRPPRPLDVDPAADDTSEAAGVPPRSQRTAGLALEIAAIVCLVASFVAATFRHRDDVDVGDFTISVAALILVGGVLAIGRWRAAATARDGARPPGPGG